jgi:hypothetical protein
VADTVAPVLEEAVAPVADTVAPVADTVAPVADTIAPVADTVAPVADTVAPVTDPLAPVTSDPLASLAPVTSDPLAPLAPVTSDPLAPVLGSALDPATALDPILGAASPQQIIEPVAAPFLEPVPPVTFAQSTQQPLLEGASYSSSVAETQVAKTVGPLGSHPPLFDTSLLLSGQLAAFAAEAAAAANELPGEIPNPLLPFGFPSSTPPVGSTFRSGSGMEIGLDILAVLALLLVLSRTGGSSVSPREGFKLVSSPRLVAELPG